MGTGGTSVSRGSGPAMILYNSARSSTVRAMGPMHDMIRTVGGELCGSGTTPANDTRCSVGLNPNTPQKCAGIRMEPERSVPMSKGVIPLATAAAAPPLDPPGVRFKSHGLFVRPKIELFV